MLYNKLAAQAPDPTLAENWQEAKGWINPDKLGNIVTELNCGCVVATDGTFILQGCEEYIQIILQPGLNNFEALQAMRSHFAKEEKAA